MGQNRVFSPATSSPPNRQPRSTGYSNACPRVSRSSRLSLSHWKMSSRQSTRFITSQTASGFCTLSFGQLVLIVPATLDLSIVRRRLIKILRFAPFFGGNGFSPILIDSHHRVSYYYGQIGYESPRHSEVGQVQWYGLAAQPVLPVQLSCL